LTCLTNNLLLSGLRQLPKFFRNNRRSGPRPRGENTPYKWNQAADEYENCDDSCSDADGSNNELIFESTDERVHFVPV